MLPHLRQRQCDESFLVIPDLEPGPARQCTDTEWRLLIDTRAPDPTGLSP